MNSLHHSHAFFTSSLLPFLPSLSLSIVCHLKYDLPFLPPFLSSKSYNIAPVIPFYRFLHNSSFSSHDFRKKEKAGNMISRVM